MKKEILNNLFYLIIKFKFLLIIFFLLIINNIYFFKFFHKLLNLNSNQDRILLYTCCDDIYSHYIPIFCNLALHSDKLKKLDIEIGVSVNKLSDNEEKALDYLRKKYSYSKIIIKYNFFIKNNTGFYYNNIKIKPNSVRFISQPLIHNKYVYITDIDIFIFIDNFYLYLIDDMKRRKSCYSNIVRPKTHHLTGLHFIEYDAYYPIPMQKKYNINDEVLLFNILKSKGIKIDYKTNYRPQFGIHVSPSRSHVSSIGHIGWGAENYKFNWINYCKSKEFRYIYPLLDKFILKKISKLNNYYSIKDKEVFN